MPSVLMPGKRLPSGGRLAGELRLDPQGAAPIGSAASRRRTGEVMDSDLS